MDLAHLGHLEMLTPKPEESLRFFIDVLGMTESGRDGDCLLYTSVPTSGKFLPERWHVPKVFTALPDGAENVRLES